MATKKAKKDPAPIRFSAAMDELQGILARLDSEEVDLDDLSELVERAAELIKLCRQRILSTDMRVREIIDQLADDLGAEQGAEPDDREESS